MPPIFYQYPIILTKQLSGIELFLEGPLLAGLRPPEPNPRSTSEGHRRPSQADPLPSVALARSGLSEQPRTSTDEKATSSRHGMSPQGPYS